MQSGLLALNIHKIFPTFIPFHTIDLHPTHFSHIVPHSHPKTANLMPRSFSADKPTRKSVAASSSHLSDKQAGWSI